MSIILGRDICGNLETAETREWLVTNGIGGYASGTVAGLLTRAYHGLLVAALQPPLDRTVLLTKVDDTVWYDGSSYPLSANRWSNGTVTPHGYLHLESFRLEGTVPVWHYTIGDARLEKRIWMQQGANTTYIQYYLSRATRSLSLHLKALVNYRDHHSQTRANNWRMEITPVGKGVCVTAFAEAVPFYLLSDRGDCLPTHEWYYDFNLAVEHRRGLRYRDEHLHAATFTATLEPGDTLTLVASTERQENFNGAVQLESRHLYERELLSIWQAAYPPTTQPAPTWIQQLVLAADQFIVQRPLTDKSDGKTVIAGYHWFSDWGRDTMISLPGLTLATGRPEIARAILRTFAQYVDRGMLPNRFPDDGAPLTDADYNSVDSALWYFEAIRQYYALTSDEALLRELFPILEEIIDWHRHGTRYSIKLDPSDGLIYAGNDGVQLTWMDAKVDSWVVTPRRGKPVEINALWYNALRTMAKFAHLLDQPSDSYEAMAAVTSSGFSRFWNPFLGCCFDVIDTPEGNDDSLRPNQIFAVSLPESSLSLLQQRQVLETCGRNLLTSFGLRSLDPSDPQYCAQYDGDRVGRDGAYHQGTVWGWLIGPFVLAHLRVFQKPALAREFLEPFAQHLGNAGIGTISEIFDGDVPFEPKGCIAQAWSVAEVLRAWVVTR